MNETEQILGLLHEVLALLRRHHETNYRIEWGQVCPICAKHADLYKRADAMLLIDHEGSK